MRDQVTARYRSAVALELRALGHSYDEIAQLIGFTHRSAARKAVMRGLRQRELNAATRYRMQRYAELQVAHVRLWPAAMMGDTRAVEQCLRAAEERMALIDLQAV